VKTVDVVAEDLQEVLAESRIAETAKQNRACISAVFFVLKEGTLKVIVDKGWVQFNGFLEVVAFKTKKKMSKDEERK
jgi:predicted DNA-binding transcriptional regulator